MSELTMTAGGAAAVRTTNNWIINKRSDLLWFIGGALAGYSMFFLHAGLALDMVTVWFLWVVFLDTPHFFGTYVRTYFDKEEFGARKKLLLGSLAWLGFGPMMIGFAFLMHQAGMANYRLPFLILIVFFNLWAYWHVVRQHWGILALYRRKNNDFSKWDTQIDRALLYVGLLAPFVAFLVRHSEARTAVGLSAEFPAWPAGSMWASFMAPASGPWHWEHVVVAFTALAVVSMVVAFLGRQAYRYGHGMPLNVPKILFMAALIPLYSVICYSPAVLTAPLLAFGAFVTVYHDVQYHAIVYFYSRNRYHKPGVDKKKYGLAPRLTKNFATYIIAGIAMAGAFRLLGCSFDVHAGCMTLVLTSKQTLFGSITTKELLVGFMLGFPLHHYFVDQFIWRPSKDANLRADLKMKGQTAS
jgi:hypothetical protein